MNCSLCVFEHIIPIKFISDVVKHQNIEWSYDPFYPAPNNENGKFAHPLFELPAKNGDIRGIPEI